MSLQSSSWGLLETLRQILASPVPSDPPSSSSPLLTHTQPGGETERAGAGLGRRGAEHRAAENKSRTFMQSPRLQVCQPDPAEQATCVAATPASGPGTSDGGDRFSQTQLSGAARMSGTAAWILAFPGLGTKEGGRGEAHSTLEG